MTIAASPVSEELKQIKSSEYNKIIKILSPKAAPAWSDKAIYKTTLIKRFRQNREMVNFASLVLDKRQ
ncbi:hypothetical protein RBB68_01170 [Leptospira interrogans]|uniref:Uncharacterized protein n=8 Tax=Leptospira interrogans TaxID=173 RepID=A0AAQ0AVU6_LEPIR|nr:hypothetical protein [Leptospira interrogans]EMF72562.1 hypothetical protein LEP1GSC148_3261 [Leptospira interrogans serovar Canicola str. LT1962]EMG10059.1 hypothetical protein LEP1GSC151_4599 [Leptospira interrogans serovar Grippotyphosa str. LT2186]EMG21483.1 hypothetical protein LEP1GSC150_4771 [Leptospira interrogans serovar Copenhageni str. LT2050]EMN73422.1 hypothetical protein LEP1GSC100_2306 [Leptospira interrogans serovar Bataviae str. UI 08561]EMO03031.1 hypothetical protein LEP1